MLGLSRSVFDSKTSLKKPTYFENIERHHTQGIHQTWGSPFKLLLIFINEVRAFDSKTSDVV